jgi:cellulose synthase (UDP-forming)
MVYDTARSVLEQDYPQDKMRLVISDDAHREGMRLAVQRLQGEHPGTPILYHEPPRRGDPRRRGEAKAGNLNSALDVLQVYAPGVEFVETRDADDKVGDGAFLRKTIGQLQADPRAAFVQTIKEGATSANDPFGNLEPLFYRRAMLARHATNSVFPCGSGLVWRLTALNDIGNFPSWNLVEDLQSGVEALRRGWRGVYLPIVGAIAQSTPEDIPNVIKQRGTWALDTLRLTFWGEKRGLSAAQRLQFAELGLFYLISFAVLVFAVTPAISLFFDIHPLTTNEAQYALHVWPYVLTIELLLISLAWGLPYEALWRSRQMWLGLAPVYMRATILALRFGPKHKPSYRVTRKDQVYAWYWRLVLPQMALLVLLLAAMAYHLMTRPLLTEADLGSIFWAGFFVLGLSRIVQNSWHGVTVRKRLPAGLRASPAAPEQQALSPQSSGTERPPRRQPAYWLLAAVATALVLLGLATWWPRLEWSKAMARLQPELHRIQLVSQVCWDAVTGDYATAEQNLRALLGANPADEGAEKPDTEDQQPADLNQIQFLSQAGWDLATGDYGAAEEKVRTLLSANPTDEVAQRHLAEIQRQAALSAGYVSVREAIAREDWAQVERLLAELEPLEPHSEIILALQASQRALQARSTLFRHGEEAYRAGEWAQAAVAYEVLREWDAGYREQTVAAHLADSYVRQGMLLVESTRGDTSAVQQAKGLFRQALSLQPEQERAASELALAEKYLQGRELLAQNDLQGATRAWQWVYELNPGYAGGGVAVFLEFFGPPAGAGPGTE